MAGTRPSPDRARILGALAATNARLRPLFVVWPVAALIALTLVDLPVLVGRLPYAAIAVLVAGWPVYVSAFYVGFKKVRWVDDIAPDRRLGRYTRDDLRQILDDVHRALGIPRGTPAAITPDKDLNASAMNLGLAGLFPKLDAIYVHRPMLHVLSPRELASVVGHELGHYHRYKVDFARATPLHLLLLGSVALLIVSRVGEPWWAFGGVAAAAWLHNTFIGILADRHRRPIEHLCDEAGAEASGVIAAINCELKLGVEAEASLALQDQLLRTTTDIPVARLFALYEASIPFGAVDHEELERRVRAALAREREARRGLSLAGFLAYLQESDAGDTEVRRAGTTLVPTGRALEWDRAALEQPDGLTEAQLATLVDALDADPEALFLRLPGEVSDPRQSSHPPASRRVLYLWRNRAAIERTAR